MQKINRLQKPDWFKDIKTDEINAVLELALNNQNHCSYTDRIIDKGDAMIDHFKPTKQYPELINDWGNLFLVDANTYKRKANRYNELLLNPSDDDYDFDRYFIIDFEQAILIPNPKASPQDTERAKVTIDLLDLNNSFLVQDRKTVMERYLSLYKKLKEKAEEDERKFDRAEYKELDSNNYSYRFLLERVLLHVFIKKNEYIKEIIINKYFGIQDFRVSDLEDKREIYFLGENGDGKTLVLQAIVLALRGLDESFLDKALNEKLTKDFDIQITDSEGDKYRYNKYVTYVNANTFAYGTGRLHCSSERKYNSNEFLNLFKFDSPLYHPEKWLEEIERLELKGIGTLKLNDALSLLTSLLENKVEIQRTNEGGFVFNEHGTRVSFERLSDGYRSTMIWLCNLIQHFYKKQPDIKDLKQYKGIVLVDEIGVFLHPRWEYSIIKKLTQTFPLVQWIFTTHSPVVILGASADAVIYRLYKENGITKVTKPYNEPLNMTANSLLTSMLWRLEDFATAGTPPEFISSDDYPYQKIHQVISKYIQEVPELDDAMVLKMIEEEFEKIRNR